MVFKIIVVGSIPASLVFNKVFFFLKNIVDFKFFNNFTVQLFNFFYNPKDVKKIYYDYSVFELKNKHYSYFLKFFSFSDFFFPYFLSLFFIKKDYKISLFRSYY